MHAFRVLIFLVLIYSVNSKSGCLFEGCICKKYGSGYTFDYGSDDEYDDDYFTISWISCEDDQFSRINYDNDDSLFIINLRLKGKTGLELIKKYILSNISLYLLYLSFDKNDLDPYFEGINKLEKLVTLNLSHNKI